MKKCYIKVRFITRAPWGHVSAIGGNLPPVQSSLNSRSHCYFFPFPVGFYDNLDSRLYRLDEWWCVTLLSICLHMLKFVLSPQEREEKCFGRAPAWSSACSSKLCMSLMHHACALKRWWIKEYCFHVRVSRAGIWPGRWRGPGGHGVPNTTELVMCLNTETCCWSWEPWHNEHEQMALSREWDWSVALQDLSGTHTCSVTQQGKSCFSFLSFF